ncbi:ATP-binding protein [Halalkalibacter nanhaiisediminis]|uniref:Signal transduction histidine kinase n=1 Tax=Halalkalibacter nanhaiisediminis TaxID=688079 RepID=A0A562QHW3_9BACI|nr:ATP-binding protein [Halalkalibacter nanhaiisediminis]TWI56334.1 signal transduction histidine kinase [Halalkalibacter nanhaiisediminis]
MDQLKFKISSGLKNLIGKELITDEYIAIFELVKNSFDAHATKVKVVFENIYSEDSQITIIDNGKGMNLDDIENKWLFVAYSAKKDGTEDNDLLDYRDKIQPKRVFAGAKGVGRFSCDRLGKELNLVTLKKEKNAEIESINVNWMDFEKDTLNEFIEIGINHNKLKENKYNIDHGTILEIKGLRDEWNRGKLLKLKKSLEKLINPNQDSNGFSIELIAKDEFEKDKKEKNEWNVVNGSIRNTLFEKLDLKTTHVVTQITKDGSQIVTTLYDRGKYIYKITEKNPYNLSNIDINLFYLNRIAKLNFSNLMGIRSVSYGSVFMYKNGFRIYPYGEEGEDPLNLDRRKAQGHSRHLGTRELIGRIEIQGEENNLIETTSRDGGFIKNNSYHQLVEFFYEKALKILEKYVVTIIKWGEPFDVNGEDEKRPALNPEDVRKEIIEYIKRLSNAKNKVISIEYNNDFLNLIEQSKEKSATNVISNLAKKAFETVDNPEIHKEIEKVGKKFNELLTERKEIELEREKTNEELKIKEKELELTTSQNLFLKSVSTTDTKELISLQHHINHGTVRINRNIDRLKNAIERNATKEELNRYIEVISLENNKISTIAKFVTKANFSLTASAISTDLVEFVSEYIENVYKEYKHLKINNQNLYVNVMNSSKLKNLLKFRPLEIIIIIDNLLNNSLKARASNVNIDWRLAKGNYIEMVYKDDGIGISDDLLDKVLDFGFTTTNGTGLGLYHIDQILQKMNGYLDINNKVENGVEFIVGVKNGA